MSPELKSRWVAALRSGDFVQGFTRYQYVSKGEVRFCVVGVLSYLLSGRPIGRKLTSTAWARLVQLNDARLTFPYLADIIESADWI